MHLFAMRKERGSCLENVKFTVISSKPKASR